MWDDIATLLPLGVAYGQILTMTDQVEDAQAWLARAPEEVGAYTATLTGAAHGTHFERRFSVYRGPVSRAACAGARSAPRRSPDGSSTGVAAASAAGDHPHTGACSTR